MTDEQIDKMLEMHRYLIKCEIRQTFDIISQDDRASILQEEVNNKHWEEFSKWFKMIRDK